jgi:hypothetical protein
MSGRFLYNNLLSDADNRSELAKAFAPQLWLSQEIGDCAGSRGLY